MNGPDDRRGVGPGGLNRDHHDAGPGPGGYLAPLDGLRFVAFLLVLVHHLPVPVRSGLITNLQLRGWVGVELFFVLSAFLFFHHFRREHARTGRISVRHFWGRRLLRLYPLMVAFPLASMLWWGTTGTESWLRLAGIALFADNLIAWFKGYNAWIPDAEHLWTLSSEFQIYLVIPVAFLAFARLGPRRFLLALGAVLVFCTALRAVFGGLGAPHPIVWVTPFLRPDTVLTGMLLGALLTAQDAARLPARVLGAAALLVVAAAWLFFRQPSLAAMPGTMTVYPLAALGCGGLLVLALGWRPLSRALSWAPVVYLGRISFGLYVYHLLAMRLLWRWMPPTVPAGQTAPLADWGLRFVAVLGLCIAMASLSYHLLERPLLRLKDRLHAPGREPAPAPVGGPFRRADAQGA